MRHILRYYKSILYLTLCGIIMISSGSTAMAFDVDFYSGNDVQFSDPNASECMVNASANPLGSGGGQVGSDFTLGTDNSMRAPNLVKQLMQDYNLSDFQAAGIVGNFMWESGGEHLPPDVNEGRGAGPPAFSGGYGWAQWTGGRQVKFIDYAIDKNYMANRNQHATDAANYAFLKSELSFSEIATLPAVARTQNVDQATTEFEDKFERAGNPRIEERKEKARKVLQAVQNNTGIDASGTTTPITSTSCSAGGTTGGSIFSEVIFPLTGIPSSVTNPGMFKNNTADRGGHPYIAFDILANTGTPVVAMASGTVSKIGNDRCGGTTIQIYHEEKQLTLTYMHLSSSTQVSSGSTVEAGTPIGSVGSASAGCGTPHLHIDAIQGNVRLACSRLFCPSFVKNKFIDIGPDLYRAFNNVSV